METWQLWSVLAVFLAYFVGYYRGRHVESFNADRDFHEGTKECIASMECEIRWLRSRISGKEEY